MISRGIVKDKAALLLLDDAVQWQSRAEEMRAVADDMADKGCQATARRLADDYDRMANHAEFRARIDGASE